MQGHGNKTRKAIPFVVVLVMFAGCVDFLPPPDAPPVEVVETFASEHGNYDLMSVEYKNSTSETIFLGKIIECKPNFKFYEFVEVVNGSEKIEGNSAEVEIRYRENLDKPIFVDYNPLDKESQDTKTKTIHLTKETDGWRLRELYCELVGK